jgi:septum site-determining protein MinC
VLRKTESIVVIGDVNPGAQVISGGDVMVWGRLRGVAHAGADGNDRAVVTALDFAPTQLRIAALTTISPESRRGFSLKFWKKEPPRRPESARILEGRIVVEPWDEAKPSAIAKWRG